MKNLYVIAKETVVEIEGQPNELGYILFSGTALFNSFEQAAKAIVEVGLPLGWIVIRLQDIAPQLDAAVRDYVGECMRVSEERS